jgi:hypothetical protein
MCTHFVLIPFLLYHEPIWSQELPKQGARIRLNPVDGFHKNLLMTGANIGLENEIFFRLYGDPGPPDCINGQCKSGRLLKQFFYIRKWRQNSKLCSHTPMYLVCF